MIKIPDVTKPVTKLLEVVASGVAALFRPWITRRDARARADEMKILAGADREIRLIAAPAGENDDAPVGFTGGPDAIFLAEIFERQQARTVENIQQILEHARLSLPEVVSDQSVDDAWTARFFGHVQYVSSSDMQSLWGKILANEVATPGQFSRRALDLVANLSTDEANTFQDFLRYVCLANRPCLPYCAITEGRLPALREAGLLGAPVSAVLADPAERVRLAHGHRVVSFSPKRKTHGVVPGWQLEFAGLSSAGSELYGALKPAEPTPSDARTLLASVLESRLAHFFDCWIVGGDGAEIPLVDWLAQEDEA